MTNKLTVLEIKPGNLYQNRLIAGYNLYKTDDYYDSRVTDFEIEKDESLLIVSLHPTRNGYYAIKVISKEKMGWMFVETTDAVFVPLEEAYPNEYKEAMEVH